MDNVEIVPISLRESTNSKEWWRQQSCPVGLLAAAQAAVSSALNLRSRRGALAILPSHCADAAAALPSTRAGKMARWLNSEEAALWRIDRKNLFPGST